MVLMEYIYQICVWGIAF